MVLFINNLYLTNFHHECTTHKRACGQQYHDEMKHFNVIKHFF